MSLVLDRDLKQLLDSPQLRLIARHIDAVLADKQA